MKRRAAFRNIFFFTLASLLLTACASYSEVPTNALVVRPAEVIDSVKCGLAKSLFYDKGNRSGLKGSTAAVQMSVNMVLGTTTDGKLEVGIPVVIGGLPGTITPSFGGNYSEERKTNTKVNFNVKLNEPNVAICRHAELGHDAGYSEWIGSIVTSVNLAVAGEPKASMQLYDYETFFTVKSGSSAGVSAEIVPVKASVSVAASRSDVQHLKITIKPVHCARDTETGKIKCGKGGPEYFQ